MEPRTLSITFTAIDTLIKYHVDGDLHRIYSVSKRDGTDFNLAYIPASFKVPHLKQSDTNYMRQLYELGFRLGVKGYPWAKQPPQSVSETSNSPGE